MICLQFCSCWQTNSLLNDWMWISLVVELSIIYLWLPKQFDSISKLWYAVFDSYISLCLVWFFYLKDMHACVLLSNDCMHACHCLFREGQCEIFLWHDSAMTYVAHSNLIECIVWSEGKKNHGCIHNGGVNNKDFEIYFVCAWLCLTMYYHHWSIICCTIVNIS